MKIIERYIMKDLIRQIVLALVVLLALFAFFSLIDQLEQTGTGSYDIPEAFIYVFLTLPKLAYELLPIAAVVGSMAFLGQLAQGSELAVLRTSGVSLKDMVWYLCKASFILIAVALVIGELIAPGAEEMAKHRRSVAMSEQIALKTKYGFWSRDGQSYINIRKILPGNELQEIYIYEFDDSNHLRSSIRADSARYEDEQWILEDIVQSVIHENHLEQRQIKRAAWDTLLSPSLVDLVVVEPQHLSLWNLYSYIQYLNKNEQNSLVYEQALWFKILKPLSIILMILIALPLVHANARNTAVGSRVFIGCLIGVMFHIFNQVCGHLGVVYEFSALFSSLLPNLILAGILYYLFQRRSA